MKKVFLLILLGLILFMFWGCSFNGKEKPLFSGNAISVFYKDGQDRTQCINRETIRKETALAYKESDSCLWVETYNQYIVITEKRANTFKIIIPRERVIQIITEITK